MANYESVLIARQDLGASQINTLVSDFSEVIKKEGGEVVKVDNWGLKNLAYRIKKNRKGYYVLLNIVAPAQAISEFERRVRLNEDVIRYMTVKVTEFNNEVVSDEEIAELKNLSLKNGLGCLIAPNFSTGAVLMMKFAQMASKYFDNAEIIELHHNQKKDAPSGTAVKTALMMAGENTNFTTGNCQEVETIKGARGANSYNNIHIHIYSLGNKY